MSKVSIPKGMRDFTPEVMARRNFIFDTIKKHFQHFGYAQIETPSMENRSTLTGKYGEEGDRLIFNVLNSGDFLQKADAAALANKDSNQIRPQLADKALRYDLTVPFARFVVQHQNELTFPFKRFQIQPVWRADRPQKARYREFYQCDADVIGSDSLLNELELLQLFDLVLSDLGLKDFTVKINNRKILAGLASKMGTPDRLLDISVSIDKLDKIGMANVKQELTQKGYSNQVIGVLESLFNINGDNSLKLNSLKEFFNQENEALKGIAELEELFTYLEAVDIKNAKFEIDLTLARGLDYYTGCIFEVQSNEVEIGSICGGGRYADLTGIFGLKDLSGVGISFGADRIYDVMEELQLFKDLPLSNSTLLFINFGEQEALYILPYLQKLRADGISAEIYPDAAKMKKQMKYADQKQIPWVVLLGEEEMKNHVFTLKNMESGEQFKLSFEALLKHLKMNWDV